MLGGHPGFGVSVLSGLPGHRQSAPFCPALLLGRRAVSGVLPADGLGLPAAGNQRQSLPSLPAAVEGGPSPRHWAAAPVSGNFGSAGHPCCSAVLLSPVVLAADFRVVFLVASSSGLPVGPTYGSAIQASGQLINKGRRLTFSKTLKPASLCQNGVGRTPISIHSFFEQGDIPTSLPCRKRIAVAPLAAAIFTRK